jgi:hypothetical protein
MAMLFLVLFSTLAVGFIATTGMSSQVAKNEPRQSGGGFLQGGKPPPGTYM